MIETLTNSAAHVLDLANISAILLGSIIGFVFGALPGLGSIQALALMLPFTFGWNPVVAMYLYAGIMGATSEGGSVSAILLNTPGTPINAATCFDGYPMARRGEAGRALGLAAASSVFGAFVGLVILVAMIPFIQPIVLAFGPPEIFWLVMFGLVSISVASQGNMLKGLASGGIGILLSMIGYSDVFGVKRWTGGSEYLWDGINLVAFFVGIFAISEVIEFTSRGGRIAQGTSERFELKGFRQVYEGAKEVFKYPTTFLRSSLIGTIIGIIPGVGGTVANFVAYTTTLQVSKNRALLGTGHPEGIIASESSNDAKDGGSIFPTLAFGIPGSAEMAILLGAMILLGLHPGPMILHDHAEVVWALVLGLILSNVLASLFILFSANALTRLTYLPVYFIGPVVAILAVVGAYALRGNLWDVALTIVAGFFGYCCKHFGYPIISLAIGFVLGSIAEKAFYHSLMISYGSYSVFFNRPISLILLGITIGVLLLAFVAAAKRRRSGVGPRPHDSWMSLGFGTALALSVALLLIADLHYAPDVRLLPLVIGLPTLTFLVIHIVNELRFRVSTAFFTSGELPKVSDLTIKREDTAPRWQEALKVVGWLVAFFCLFVVVGFFAAMPVFLAAFLVIRGRVNFATSVLFTLGVWLLCYVLFQWAFEFTLWPGIIPEYVPGILGGGILPPV